MGKVVFLTLEGGKAEERDTEDFPFFSLGGRGLATRIYWEEARPEVSAFDPENPLIFMVGPAVATGAKAANRMAVVGKSPLTYPRDCFCYGNLGGFFPSFFRRAGLDGLVLKGKAERPSYLFLAEGRVYLLDATDLWGKGALETIKVLKERHGPGAEVLAIGPAGEKGVAFATLVASHGSSATGGFGAVLGSKNIKAIVAKASRKVLPRHPEALKKVNDKAKALGRRLRLSIPPKTAATGRAGILRVVGRGSCFGCDLECIRGKYDYGGLVGYRKCQAMEYYLPWLYGKEDEPIETLFRAPEWANDFGLCTFELEAFSDWLYAAHREGDLTSEEAGLPLEEIGTGRFLLGLLEAIVQGRGIGEVLAQGIARARDRLEGAKRETLDRLMKPISLHLFLPLRDLDDVRGHLVNALLYQMEPRRHRPLIHQGFALVAWQFHQRDPQMSPVDWEAYREICEVFWGSSAAADDSTYEGKALAAVRIQDRIYWAESLGLCTFGWPIVYSLNTPDKVGDPNLEAHLLAAVKGIAFEEAAETLVLCGKQTAALQRLILLREGWPVPDSDWPPDYHFTQPLPPHPFGQRPVFPGPGGKPFTAEGKLLDRHSYRRMLLEYYHLRGWDERGIPLLETLRELRIKG